MTGPSYQSITSEPDRLFAGEFPRSTRQVTILSGEVRPRGTVMGRITASGKYVLSDDAAADGSQTPEAILVDDVDASGGDVEAAVYLSGEFNDAALTLGGAHTADTIRQAFRNKSIFLKATVAP